MGLSSLSNNILIISYKEAIKLNLSPEFISILESEIINRDLSLESFQVKQLTKFK